MGIDDLQELYIEDEEEVEFYEDSGYEPEKEFDLPSLKRNPLRRRRQPIRYPAPKYEVNVIKIEKKQPEVDHTTLRRNITMLHISAILLLFIINGTNAQIVNDTQNLGRLFESVHLCGSLVHHAYYMEIHKIMSCHWTDPREPIVEDVLITTFFPKTFSEKIPAYSCTVEILTITTYLGVWGTKSVLDKKLQQRKLDYDECWKQSNRIEDKTTTLKRISHGVWTNDSSIFVPTYRWLSTVEQIRYRMVVRKIDVRFNFQNNQVVSSYHAMTDCKKNDNYCEFYDTTIVWKANASQACPLKEGAQVVAKLMNDARKDRQWRLTSDMAQFSLSGSWYTFDLCSWTKLRNSEQGIVIRFDEVNVTDSTLRKVLRQLERPGVPTTTTTGMMTYVAHKLQNLAVELFKKNWLNICRLNQERTVYKQHLASTPNSTHLAVNYVTGGR